MIPTPTTSIFEFGIYSLFRASLLMSEFPRNLQGKTGLCDIFECHFSVGEPTLRLDSFDDILHAGPRRRTAAPPRERHQLRQIMLKGFRNRH
jgi:hypothetical protein